MIDWPHCVVPVVRQYTMAEQNRSPQVHPARENGEEAGVAQFPMTERPPTGPAS